MTLEKLKQIEANIKKVQGIFPNDYGLATALELVEELKTLLARNPEVQTDVRSQSPAEVRPA